MQKVLVVGAGFMGSGIAQVCAQRGLAVHLCDVSSEALDRAMDGMRISVDKLAAKGKIAETAQEVLARVTPEQGLDWAAQADWVIEAALEDEELKLGLFAGLDRLAPPDTPLASNTSSIPISRLAQATTRPEKVLGLHFFGPVPLMGLVEVVKGAQTSDEVFERGVELVRFLGKTPVRVERDVPGFVMNRIFSAAFREAEALVAAGVTTPQDADVGMRLGYGWGAGPFEVADNAGLDTFVLISKFLRSVGEEHLVADAGLIDRLVAEGRLGRKVSKGFYRYDDQGKRHPWQDD